MGLELLRQRAAYKPDKMVVRFLAEDGPETIMCLVTLEALQDHCGLRGSDPRDAVISAEDYRSLIEGIAQHKYVAGDTDDTGNIVIRSDDIVVEKLEG